MKTGSNKEVSEVKSVVASAANKENLVANAPLFSVGSKSVKSRPQSVAPGRSRAS